LPIGFKGFIRLYRFMRYVYSLVFTLALPLIFLRLLLRSLRVPAYRQRWAERLGMFQDPAIVPQGLWLHAVSVGEVVAAVPLINALLAKFPHLPLTVTTTTPTGSQRLRQSLGAKVTHVYMPYDLPWAINGFLDKIKPSCLIIMETELWPNLLNVCQSHKIPVILVNGRLSDKSMRGYMRIHSFVSSMLQQVTFVAAQSEHDAARFRQLGLAADKLQVSGNLKYDVQVPILQQQLGKDLKGKMADRFIWVAASTHGGEEEQILTAFKTIQEKCPQCLLILVPRHPDRFNDVANLLERNSLEFVRRSQGTACSNSTAVLLGDTMGELNIFYAAADVAFVGGSLIPFGGHNLLEPAGLGVATVTGPHTTNFQEITKKLQEAGGLCIVQDADQLAVQLLEMFEQITLRFNIGAKGLAVVEQNRGAVSNVVGVVALNANLM
jgi:3-deoxy-D-manno-octulosonic-acid transferase